MNILVIEKGEITQIGTRNARHEGVKKGRLSKSDGVGSASLHKKLPACLAFNLPVFSRVSAYAAAWSGSRFRSGSGWDPDPPVVVEGRGGRGAEQQRRREGLVVIQRALQHLQGLLGHADHLRTGGSAAKRELCESVCVCVCVWNSSV